MAKIETFRDISRNVEIRVIWFSEFRTMVASFCWKPYVLNVSLFRLIYWPIGPKKLYYIIFQRVKQGSELEFFRVDLEKSSLVL